MREDDLGRRLRLVVITDDRQTPDSLLETAQSVVGAGVPALQLRLKAADARTIYDLATRLLQITRPAGALLFVNDRMDVALSAGADGTHLGDDDLPLTEARRIAPNAFLIGRSVDGPEEAAIAAREGADYVGFGPIYETTSKSGLPSARGVESIGAVRRAANLPVVAIGGISEATAGEVFRAGADGVAVISAISKAGNPEVGVRQLLAAAAERR